MFVHKFAIVICLAGLLTARADAIPVADSQSLYGTSWQLRTIDGDLVGKVLTVTFRRDGRIFGYDACNDYSMGFSQAGTRLMVAPGGLETLAGCMDSSSDAAPNPFDLVKLDRLDLAGDVLTLTVGGTSPTWTFDRLATGAIPVQPVLPAGASGASRAPSPASTPDASAILARAIASRASFGLDTDPTHVAAILAAYPHSSFAGLTPDEEKIVETSQSAQLKVTGPGDAFVDARPDDFGITYTSWTAGRAGRVYSLTPRTTPEEIASLKALIPPGANVTFRTRPHGLTWLNDMKKQVMEIAATEHVALSRVGLGRDGVVFAAAGWENSGIGALVTQYPGEIAPEQAP